MLPESVGGQADFMVGIKYARYHPANVYSLPFIGRRLLM